MANGRVNRKKGAVTVRGRWFALSVEFLRSRACAQLSPHALKLLFDLCSQLGYNARNNGDLSAAPTIMRPRGWTSTATLVAALGELIECEVVVITRRGNRRSCALYAVALWPMDCDLSKLDHGPGCYSTTDWMSHGADEPTLAAPAVWKRPRHGAKSSPATGEPRPVMHPPRENLDRPKASYAPATGVKGPISTPEVLPLRDTFLRTPSAGAGPGPVVMQDGGAGAVPAGRRSRAKTRPKARTITKGAST